MLILCTTKNFLHVLAELRFYNTHTLYFFIWLKRFLKQVFQLMEGFIVDLSKLAEYFPVKYEEVICNVQIMS